MKKLLEYLYHDEKLIGKEIVQILNIGQSTLSRWMRKFGVQTRSAGRTEKVYWDKGWLINQHYTLDKTLVQIARENGISAKTIGSWMKKNSIETRKYMLENHPSWRGGRHVRPDGYIAIRTEYGDELEHRVVMARTLGRRLERTEIIHHIDGDRTNNKIENLEVMSLKEHLSLGYTSGYNQGFIDCALDFLAHGLS